MSNNWNFKILFDDSLSSKIRTERLIQAIQDNDFRYHSALSTNKFRLIDTESFDEIEFDSEAEMVDLLSRTGGGLMVWLTLGKSASIEDGFFISYHLRSQLGEAADNGFSQSVGEMNLNAADVVFRDFPKDKNSWIIAQHIIRLFKSLCYEQDAIYGHCIDDYTFEGLFRVEILDQIIPALMNNTPVPHLFWMNYFSESYLSGIGLRELPDFGADIEALGSGKLVSFLEYPWEAGSAFQRLVHGNDTWNRMFHKGS